MTQALVAIAPDVWIYPADPDARKVQPNIGVIVTAGGTILVDAGNSPSHGRRVLRALAEIDAPPVTDVIYTHHHWDHVFGAQVFGARAFAHALCREILADRATWPWSYPLIEDEIQRSPALETMYRSIQGAVEDWNGFQIAVPDVTFTGRLLLHRGDMVIELEHVGGQHSADSVVVWLPSAGVAFVGDSFYRPVPAARLPDATHDAALVGRLLARDGIGLYVDGHTPEPQAREAFARLADAPA